MDSKSHPGWGKLTPNLRPVIRAATPPPPDFGAGSVQGKNSYKPESSREVRPRTKGPKRRRVQPDTDPLTIKIEQSSDRPVAVSPEDRDRARSILDEIGKRFADNRGRVGKSAAYEAYQNDLALNLQYLVAGGLLSVKELSELFMKIEEFRKSTAEAGKTPATLLAEWLRGDGPDIFSPAPL